MINKIRGSILNSEINSLFKLEMRFCKIMRKKMIIKMKNGKTGMSEMEININWINNSIRPDIGVGFTYSFS